MNSNQKGIAHILIMLLVLAATGVFGYYFYQTNQTSREQATATPPPQETENLDTVNSFRLTGIDYFLENAIKVELEESKNDLLILNFRVEANVECPLTGGAVCGYDARRFKLTDDEGFVLERTGLVSPLDKVYEPLSEKILRQGEKDRGMVKFAIPKDKSSFILSYSNSSGTETKSLTVVPEVYDPIADWETYTNREYGFSFKYPPNWEVKSESENRLTLIPDNLSQELTVYADNITGFGYCFNYFEEQQITIDNVAATTADGVGGADACDNPSISENTGNTFVLIPLKDEANIPDLQVQFSYTYKLEEKSLAKNSLDQILSTFQFLDESDSIMETTENVNGQ